MKKSLITLAIASLISSTAFATELKTTEQKASYTLGTDLAKNLATQGIHIDMTALIAGIRDITENKKPQLTEQEMQAAIMQLKKELMAKKIAEHKKLAQQNAKAGADFLAKNKTKPGIKVLPGGLQYKVIKAGKGPHPTENDYITAHYEGRLLNGKVFDSSFKRGKPLEFQMGDVIKGWGEALKQMRPGAKWEIYVPASLAYGERGAGKVIGPNETLIFTIDFIHASKQKPQH